MERHADPSPVQCLSPGVHFTLQTPTLHVIRLIAGQLGAAETINFKTNSAEGCHWRSELTAGAGGGTLLSCLTDSNVWLPRNVVFVNTCARHILHLSDPVKVKVARE